VLRLLESCLCPPTPLSLAVSLPRLLILAAIAAPTCVAARCAAPAWRPRLLLPPSPRPLLIVLASLPQLLGSRRPHKQRLTCSIQCRAQPRTACAAPRTACAATPSDARPISTSDRLARSKGSDAGDRYRLCAVRWPKTRRRLVPQCCCCGSRQRHDQRCRRGAAAHRARSAALPHRRRPGRSERRRRAARDALSVTPACAAAARRLLHC